MAHGYSSEAEWLDELLGRGPGDPDAHSYPGEANPAPKVISQNKNRKSVTTLESISRGSIK